MDHYVEWFVGFFALWLIFLNTADNDVDYIDRSFGFLTAVEAAQASIHAAKTESMCTMPNGVTVVKLMGRSAGFLAATSAF